MNSSTPGTPRSTHSPTRELTPSSSNGIGGGGTQGSQGNNNGSGIPVKSFVKPFKTCGESLGPLVGSSLTVVGDSIYVFGGFDQYTDDVFNALYKLSLENHQWSRIIYTKGRLPAKRNDHTTSLWKTRNKLIVFGGNGEEEGRYFDDVAVLDLDTLTWWQPETCGVRPDGRMRHSATIYDDKLYIAGGLSSTQDIFADTLLILDLNTWEWYPPIPFVRRSQHISFMYNKRLYLFGGFEEDMSRSNHLSFIDMDRHGVTHLEIDSPLAPSLTGQRFSQICGDQLVVAVTHSQTTTVSGDMPATGLWTLDLTSMQWQYRDMGTSFEGYNWGNFAMAEHETCFYLFGNGIDEEQDDYYAHVLRVDLKEYGIMPVPPPQLGTDLVGLLIQQSQSADFSIRSSKDIDSANDGRYIRAHRLVLLARWPHFAHLLSSGMAESVSDTLTLPEPFVVLEAFVRFLYTDTLDDCLPPELIADLLVMANLYILPRLLALCVRRLHSDMDTESVSKIYHCAGLSGQRGLQQNALHFMFERFGSVVKTQAFRQLPHDILCQIWDETPQNAILVGSANGIIMDSRNGSHHRISDDEEEDDQDNRPGSPMEA
ncbi:hypothetical protein INT45_007643 [Circinella minor]|uniref:BTB domain-containing protein n=1 Tax=Circinella minor TaxID=1195481 RepID=A0A8H7RXH5_9FUNG|nr:hypothetical protein INT45_007643 [Circinella minor]